MRRYLAFSAVTTVAGLCAVVWTVQPASAAPARALATKTTTTLSVSPNPAQTTDTVTLTATVTSSSGTPTGTVTFYDGDNALGSATLNGSGTASTTATFATSGSHSLTATYNFNYPYLSSSGTATLTVGSAAPTVHPTNVALSVNPTSLQTGQSATLTATVTTSDGAPGTPTGSVEFYDNGNDLGGATLNGSGVATLTSSGYIAGTNAITATYAGDSTHSGASSSAVDITATAAVTIYGTSTSISANPTSVTAGSSATFTATVSSNGGGGTATGSVQFYDNGVPIGNSVTLNGSAVASLTWTGFTAGTHDVTAKYQGDSTHSVSTSSQASVTATAPPTAVTTSITPSISPNPIAAGGSATLSAHVVQVGTQTAPPQGSIVTFRNGGANGTLLGQATLDASGNASVVVSGWQAGTYTVTAVYTGDANDAPSSQGQSVTVRQVTPLTITAPSPTAVYGSGIPTLTPTYSGFVNGETTSSLTSQATCKTAATGSAPAAGTYTVTCSGASDIYYSFTYVSGTLTVTKAPLVVTPPHLTMKQGDPVPTLTPTITGFVNSEVLATSDVTGSASCTTTATSSSSIGTYPITCTLGTLSSNDYSFSVVGQGTLTVIGAGSIPTHSSVMTEGPILVGYPVTLRGYLFTDTGSLGSEPMTLTLGALSCTATTNQSGYASCSVTPPASSTLGPATLTASFAGDSTYAPSTGSRTVILYALPSGHGTFVVGDESSAHSTSVTFWSSQWWKSNEVSKGDTSKDFKGYAGSPSVPTIGSTWSSSPGDSSSPPSAPLPSYMGVIVTSSATQSGSSITGTVCNIAVVQTDGGYAPDPGHSGTGTIVASLYPLASCSSDHASSSGSGSSGDTGNSNGNGNGSDNGNGHGNSGQGSPNDYASSDSSGQSSDAHWTRHGYSHCPAL